MSSATATNDYTHQVCVACGKTLYCSTAEPWQPQTEYGWCQHGDLIAVATTPVCETDWHECGIGSRIEKPSFHSASIKADDTNSISSTSYCISIQSAPGGT